MLVMFSTSVMLLDNPSNPSIIQPMSNTKKIRVTVTFVGKQSGALGVCYEINARRTIEVDSPLFTYDDAKEAARVALYEKQDDMYAYEGVWVKSVAFN